MGLIFQVFRSIRNIAILPILRRIINLCARLFILDDPCGAARRGGGGAVPVQSVHAKDGRKDAAQGG